MQDLARFITKIIDFFYHAIQRLLPVKIPLQLFRYAVCGGGNMVLDWLLYFLIYNYGVGHDLQYFTILGIDFCMTPHITTLCIVFPVTLLTGFWLNKYITFTQSDLRGTRQLGRYILIVCLNLLVNYFGLKLCVEVFHWYPTPSKMFITCITVIISFIGQKYWSFRSSKG